PPSVYAVSIGEIVSFGDRGPSNRLPATVYSEPVEPVSAAPSVAGGVAGGGVYAMMRVQLSQSTRRSPRRISLTTMGRRRTLHAEHSSPLSSATAPSG